MEQQPMEVDKPKVEPVATSAKVATVYGSVKKSKTLQEPYSPTKGKTLPSTTQPTEVMNVGMVGDTKQEMMERADKGKFIPDLLKHLNNAKKATIQQQIIMHGITFDETHKNSVLKQMIRYSKWTEAVEDNTINNY